MAVSYSSVWNYSLTKKRMSRAGFHEASGISRVVCEIEEPQREF